MEELRVTLRVVTPLFMGGADPGKAELRPSSVKGLLRFWWRALQPPTPHNQLLERENALFGGAGEGQGQSRFMLLPVPNPNIKFLRSGEIFGGGRAYLGYGLASYKRTTKTVTTDREAIAPESEFSLRFVFRDPTQQDEVLQSLWALTHFGGMGARSRRGFGSVVVTGMEPAHPLLFRPLPTSVDQLADRLREQLTRWDIGSRKELPEYTAFNNACRVRVLLPQGSWIKAMHDVGMALNNFRVTSPTTPQNFAQDTALLRGLVLQGTPPTRAPERSVFGLPHNYFFKQVPNRNDATANIEPSGEGSTRRASPLFIRFHQLADKKVVGVLTLMPARFLPDDDQNGEITIQNRGRSIQVAAPSSFGPIERFLESLLGSLEVTP